MPVEPGQTLLHYRIVDKLGEGGMATRSSFRCRRVPTACSTSIPPTGAGPSRGGRRELRVGLRRPERARHTAARPSNGMAPVWSNDGGLEAMWSPMGELFYRRGDRWMSVAITTEPTLSWSAPRQVFQTDFVDTLGRSYDVSSDGQSLYVVKQPDPPDGTRVHVVTGWAP